MGFSRQEYWSGVPLPSLDEMPLAVCITTTDIDGGEEGKEGWFILLSLVIPFMNREQKLQIQS